jgi:hypothetical protein
MYKFQQINTFEAFCLFSMVKYFMAFDNYKLQKPELRASESQGAHLSSPVVVA